LKNLFAKLPNLLFKRYKGDDINFFKYFKLSKPAINKTEVREAKEM